MEQQTEARPAWQEMTIGTLASGVVNVGYLLLAPHDIRILLMLMATTLAAMLLLLGPRTGAYAMGMLFGAGAAILIVIAVGMAADWNWLGNNADPPTNH
jgi:uncharacterized membrane protein YccC